MNDDHMENEPQKRNGNGIIWGSAIIATAMIVSSFAYAVASSRYVSAAAPATQTVNAQNQGGGATLPNDAAGPSCGVQ